MTTAMTTVTPLCARPAPCKLAFAQIDRAAAGRQALPYGSGRVQEGGTVVHTEQPLDAVERIEAAVAAGLAVRGIDPDDALARMRQDRGQMCEQAYRTALTYRADSYLLSWSECVLIGKLSAPLPEDIS